MTHSDQVAGPVNLHQGILQNIAQALKEAGEYQSKTTTTMKWISPMKCVSLSEQVPHSQQVGDNWYVIFLNLFSWIYKKIYRIL